MAKIARLVIPVLLVGTCLRAWALPQKEVAPSVTFDKVEEIFGYNLETKDPGKRSLLLAIAMDYTSIGSPRAGFPIGVPYIVDRGPGYWVERLKSGDRTVEVLINNALLLLFTKSPIPRAEETALKLLEAAADGGYWPADYFVAETNLKLFLSRDAAGGFSLKPEKVSTPLLRPIAEDTMRRLNRCAAIGFAPCQFRIGFWLATSDVSLKDGLMVLMQAVATTLRDPRYAGVLDEMIKNASELVVMRGNEVGLGADKLQRYARLAFQERPGY